MTSHAPSSYNYQSFPPPAPTEGGYPSRSLGVPMSSYGHYPSGQMYASTGHYGGATESNRAPPSRAGYSRETVKTVSPNGAMPPNSGGYPRAGASGRFQPYGAHNPRGGYPSQGGHANAAPSYGAPPHHGGMGAPQGYHSSAGGMSGGTMRPTGQHPQHPGMSGAPSGYHTPQYGGRGGQPQPTTGASGAPAGARPQMPFERFSNLTVTGASSSPNAQSNVEPKKEGGTPTGSGGETDTAAREYMLQYLNENFKVQLQNGESHASAGGEANTSSSGNESGASGAGYGSNNHNMSASHDMNRNAFPQRRAAYAPVPDYYRNQLEHTTEPSRHTIYSLNQASQVPRRPGPTYNSSGGQYAHYQHPHYGDGAGSRGGPVYSSHHHGENPAMIQAAPPSYPPSGEYSSRRGSLSQTHFHSNMVGGGNAPSSFEGHAANHYGNPQVSRGVSESE